MALAWHRTEEAGNVAIKGGEAMTVHPHKGASMLRAVVMSPLPIRRCQFEPRPGSQKLQGDTSQGVVPLPWIPASPTQRTNQQGPHETHGFSVHLMGENLRGAVEEKGQRPGVVLTQRRWLLFPARVR